MEECWSFQYFYEAFCMRSYERIDVGAQVAVAVILVETIVVSMVQLWFLQLLSMSAPASLLLVWFKRRVEIVGLIIS